MFADKFLDHKRINQHLSIFAKCIRALISWALYVSVTGLLIYFPSEQTIVTAGICETNSALEIENEFLDSHI